MIKTMHRTLGPVEVGRPRGRVAPGPRGGWLGGSYGGLRRDELGLLTAGANRYGDVVRFELGPRPAHLVMHLIRDPDDIQHVLLEHRENYPKAFTYEVLRAVLGQGLVTSEGELWRRQRRVIQPIFRTRHVQSLLPGMVEAAEELVRTLDDAAGIGRPVDLAAEMMRYTLGVVGRALFSSDLLGAAEAVRPAVHTLLADAVDRLLNPLGLVTLLVPRLPMPANRRVQSALATLDDLVFGLIERRRAERRDDPDLLGMLLSARDEETGEPMSDAQVRDEVITFLIAGHETTSNALSWTFYLLSTHPLVARRLAEETEAVLGGRSPEVDDLEKLTYTWAVLQEAMRLYPPVGAIERDARTDDELGGYAIPAGSTVVVSPWVCHRNPAFWPAPEAFDPERFAPGSEHARFSYLPFGAGPRACIGSSFALQEAVIALAMITPRLSLDLVPGHPVDIEVGITNRPRHGLQMTPRRR